METREDIMLKIQERVHHMVQRHSKTLIIRFDVRYPQHHPIPERNDHISNLIRVLKEWYSVNNIESHYVWVREQNTSDTPHYHIMFLVNGSKIQHGSGLVHSAEKLWATILNMPWVEGLIHYCDLDQGRSWLMLERPPINSSTLDQQYFQADIQNVLARLSYLAKTYTKGHAPYRVREFGCSLLRN